MLHRCFNVSAALRTVASEFPRSCGAIEACPEEALSAPVPTHGRSCDDSPTLPSCRANATHAPPSAPGTSALRDAGEPWPAARAVSFFLPAHTVSDIIRYTQRPPRARLSECTNLAIAGTGSSTLATWLAKVSIHSHHNHALDTWERLLKWERLRGHARPKCVIVILRDPAHRLESGARYEIFERRVGQFISAAGQHLHPDNPRATKLSELIQCLRHRGDGAPCDRRCSAAGRGMLNLYDSSASLPCWSRLDTVGLSGPEHGSYFLVSQLAYLRSFDFLNASRGPDVHFLCTERLPEMWDGLVKRLSGESAGAGTGRSLQNRSSASRGAFIAKNTRLDADSAAFVRESMFAWDARLHEAFCGVAY